MNYKIESWMFAKFCGRGARTSRGQSSLSAGLIFKSLVKVSAGAAICIWSAVALADVFPTPVQVSVTPTKAAVSFDKIFVPRGFDSNDNVEVVGVGNFAHSCYHIAPADVAVDQQAHTISLSPVAYRIGGMCLQVQLPFARVVEVGILNPGHYQIIQSADHKDLGSLDVELAKGGAVDNFLYAPISQAFYTQENGASQVRLTGYFPNSCMRMKEVRSTVSADTIVILPIVEMNDNGNCLAQPTAFKAVTNLSKLKLGRYLLHVRSMNGHSINEIIDVD